MEAEQRQPGAKEAGNIQTDFTKWKKNLKITRPDSGVPYYQITYDLVRVLDGRNFKFEARYPSGTSRRKAQGIAQICIASTFKPGTT